MYSQALVDVQGALWTHGAGVPPTPWTYGSKSFTRVATCSSILIHTKLQLILHPSDKTVFITLSKVSTQKHGI